MSLSAFLAENAVPVENIKFVASKRFLGEDGNPHSLGDQDHHRHRG